LLPEGTREGGEQCAESRAARRETQFENSKKQVLVIGGVLVKRGEKKKRKQNDSELGKQRGGSPSRSQVVFGTSTKEEILS